MPSIFKPPSQKEALRRRIIYSRERLEGIQKELVKITNMIKAIENELLNNKGKKP